jgi:NAD(P)H-flavin reductase/quinol-cytochrome oxidoreductase complex cytochrome b subunit/ferredoxin
MIAALQGALRRLFMLVEALFNRAFGDRLNPFYHLGSITFFLFWIVAGSGLYLYAFFDTSVSGAYSSVQALTENQWYFGGILRSVHRYASDAMVVLMLLHMLRYFAFDRIHGFRTFSWLTGVGLIWLVYISGINGYMLPWDKLAQYVVVSSFEWMDWLPGFGGALIRNFIDPSSVNDRLFSLLAFIHIGVPLLLLLLMWVHVQRVPKASTNPPKAIRVGLMAMLLAMALLVPVHSHGGAADLASEVVTVALDWFFLPVYPLLKAWSLAAVWALVVIGTALLVLVPWLARGKRKPGAQSIYQLTAHPGPEHVNAREGETLLEAGLRAGLTLPFECRNGGCGVCVCTILNGRIDQGAFQPNTLTEQMRAEGKALMCCAVALEDVEFEVPIDSLRAAAASVIRYSGRVERMERLSDTVMRVMLSLPGGQRISFVAGQYINIILDDGERRAFSFANPPHENEFIELHVRLIPGGRFTTHVFERMQVGDTLDFEGPLGRFTLHAGTRPMLMVAGATGFAPIKSILEDAFHRGVQRPMQLYWGVSNVDDLYMLDLAEGWAREHSNFRIVPVLSDPDAAEVWHGRTGLVHQAMLEDHADLRGYEAYVCGSVKMVESAVPDFLARGLAEEACYSDAFNPARPGEATDSGRASD